jgi:hypothetical protein
MRLTEEISRIKEVMFESLKGKKKSEYFQDEMDEIERASQDLSRDGDFDASVEEILELFKDSEETKLNDEVWGKLENTESNEIKKVKWIKLLTLPKNIIRVHH